MKEINNRRKILSGIGLAGVGTLFAAIFKIKSIDTNAVEADRKPKLSVHPLAVKRNKKVSING